MQNYGKFTNKEISLLRKLAEQVFTLSQRDCELEKERLWTQHNDLEINRPLIFIDPENGWNEIIPDTVLECTHTLARDWEFMLRRHIYQATVLKDDRVTPDCFEIPYLFTDTGWGMELHKEGGEHGGAYKVVSVLKDYDEDFEKLHFPQLVIDFEGSNQLLAYAQELFEGIIPVQRYQSWWWSLGLTWSYIDLRGYEEFLCDFILEPENVHRMMDFLCTGNIKRIDWLEENGLLFSNTGNHYVGSGGLGYTNALSTPLNQKDVTTANMWGFVESQETVSVSPETYGEFVFPYHKKLASRFGLNCCCCCEPFEDRWDYLKQLPNLRRVSCSPWSKREVVEELLGENYIASLKISPTPLASPNMNEDQVRKDLRQALGATINCVPELVMKDNHTLGGNPRNASRWVEIAREEVSHLHD